MAEFDPSRFSEVTEGNSEAKRLCHDIFENAADSLFAGCFKRQWKVEKVQEEKTTFFRNDTTANVDFMARNFINVDADEIEIDWDSDEEVMAAVASGMFRLFTHYSLEIMQQRPWVEGGYWPEDLRQDIVEVDEDADGLVWGDDEETETEDDDWLTDTLIEAEHGRIVQEIRSYHIDDEDYIPRTLIKARYINDRGVTLEETDVVGGIEVRERLLGDSLEEDELFQGLEAWLAESFSSEEVEEIRSLLAQLRIIV